MAKDLNVIYVDPRNDGKKKAIGRSDSSPNGGWLSFGMQIVASGTQLVSWYALMMMDKNYSILNYFIQIFPVGIPVLLVIRMKLYECVFSRYYHCCNDRHDLDAIGMMQKDAMNLEITRGKPVTHSRYWMTNMMICRWEMKKHGINIWWFSMISLSHMTLW